jgi:hypothetical protein
LQKGSEKGKRIKVTTYNSMFCKKNMKSFKKSSFVKRFEWGFSFVRSYKTKQMLEDVGLAEIQ